MLHCILEGKSINVGRIVQKEILGCNLKQKGCLFFSSLISELCIRAGVDISSSDEVLANTTAISTTAIKIFFQSTPRPQQEQMPLLSSTRELLSAVQQLDAVVRHKLAQQQKFWAFEKEAHTWIKRMFQLNFPKKLLNSPVFPDEILLPFVPATSDPVAPDCVASPAGQCDIEEEAMPAPQPLRTRTKAKASHKGMEKVPDSLISSSESWLDRVPTEPESTPTPPLKKKPKTAASLSGKKATTATSSPPAKPTKSTTPPRKKMSQLVAAEISHYYSSTDDETLAPISKLTKKKTQVSGKKAASASQAAAPIDDEEDDLEITKEVQHTAARTLCQLAEAAKHRPGLRRRPRWPHPGRAPGAQTTAERTRCSQILGCRSSDLPESELSCRLTAFVAV